MHMYYISYKLRQIRASRRFDIVARNSNFLLLALRHTQWFRNRVLSQVAPVSV